VRAIRPPLHPSEIVTLLIGGDEKNLAAHFFRKGDYRHGSNAINP